MRQLCHQTLISWGGSQCGWWVKNAGEERQSKRGWNWCKMGLFHSSLEMLSQACSCLLTPSWLPDVIVNCGDTIRLWLWSMRRCEATQACNISVLLYTCAAVIAKIYVWVGGQKIAHSEPRGVKQHDYSVCVGVCVWVCTQEILTRTVGWVSPMEHHLEVSPTGYSVASWIKTNENKIKIIQLWGVFGMGVIGSNVVHARTQKQIK